MRRLKIVPAGLLAVLNAACEVIPDLHDVVLDAPVTGAVVYHAEVTVNGSANEYSSGVDRVVYILNGGVETVATGPLSGSGNSYNFSFVVPGLKPGLNEILVRAYDPQGGSLGAVATVRYIVAEVILDYDLSGGGADFPAGTRVSLSRVNFEKVADEDTCDFMHLHASVGDGIVIDSHGPYADRNPGGCGYGIVVYLDGNN